MRARLARFVTALAVCTTAAAIGASTVGANRDRERTISLYNIHTKETVSVTYKRDGKYVPAAMERVNWVLRDWRKDEATTMDPELVDLLWEIHTELGSQKPIHIISGFRSRGTNSMLKKTRGGQADNSQHINGKAADVHFPDVPVQRLRYSALIRERGGVGYYPVSAIPFVHVDTARVRAWPRLPRSELALLFPSGRTQHMPADGGPLTSNDGREARMRLASAGGEIGAFLNLRRNGPAQATIVAEARPPTVPSRPAAHSAWEAQTVSAPKPPTLSEQPRVVASGPAPIPPAAQKDRARLHELAALASLAPEPRLISTPRPAVRPPSIASLAEEALEGRQASGGGHQVAAIDAAAWTTPQGSAAPTGRFGWATAGQDMRWVPATEFDDDHSDELNYRPFAIAPLLTDHADEPLLAELVAHDPGRTLDMIDQPVSQLPLHFRPTEQVAATMWTQQFTGSAVGLDRLNASQPAGTPPMRQRAVQTSSR